MLISISGGPAAAQTPTPTPCTFTTAGLQLWLKADAITGFSDGTSLTSWPDSSGNGNTAAQSTVSLQPVYRVNVINGQPAVNFTANTKRMPLTSPITTTAYTAVAMYTATAETNLGAYLLGGSAQGVYSGGTALPGPGEFDSTNQRDTFLKPSFSTWSIFSATRTQLFLNGSETLYY